MRTVYQAGQVLLPSALLSDTSQPRQFYSSLDPSQFPGCSLAVGDVWHSALTTAPVPIRTGRPDTTNTGVLPGSVLTRYDGNIRLTVAGTVLENLDIHGNVTVAAPNCVIRNCRIRGYYITAAASAGESTIGLINMVNDGLWNLLVQDCTLIPDYPSWDWDGVLGHDFTLRRCLIAHTNDGIGIYNTHNGGGPVNVEIDSTFIGFMAYFSPTHSGNADNATHNDCIQILGGQNIWIHGSTLWGFRSMPDGMGVVDDPFGYVGQGALTVPPSGYSVTASGPYNPTYPSPCSGSVIQFNNGQGTPTNVTVEFNWIDGGGASLNIPVTIINGVVQNNRFGHNQRLAGSAQNFTVPRPTSDPNYNLTDTGLGGGSLATQAGNVYDDNGIAVHWRT